MEQRSKREKLKSKAKTKSQPKEWEKIFVNHITDKTLKSRIYKFYNSVIITTKKNPFKMVYLQIDTRLEQTSFERRYTND